MKFATFDITEAQGCVLAHTVHLPGGIIKKGRVLTAIDIAALRAADIATVMAARLATDDVAEDEAARRIATAACGRGLEIGPAFTGRNNLLAVTAGLAVIARDTLIALNSIDEGLTIATVQPFDRVERGQLVATIKIIPFALPAGVVAAAESMLQASSPPVIAVAPYATRESGLILTRVAGMKASLIDKRIRAMRTRLEALGSSLAEHETVAHDTAAVSRAIGGRRRPG